MQPHSPLLRRATHGPAAQFAGMRISLFALVLVYGFISGFRTIADFDLGWQMAEARGPLSSTDTLSYTAFGAPWIYPRLAGWIFRHLYLLGGYAAISWFCACALVLSLAVLAWRGSVPTLLLLVAAAPALAAQMIPRSGLFTVVLAAVFVRLLLSWYWHGTILSLLPLPLLMALWVNLHPGFIAGIGLLAGYVAIEIGDRLVGGKAASCRRLRRAGPWLAAILLATLLNPWGIRVYTMIAAQEHISRTQAATVAELDPLYLHFLSGTLNPLVPESAIWWIFAVTLIAIVLLVRQRRAGLALVLAIAAAVCLLSARTQGVFLPIACLIAGDALRKSPMALKLTTQSNSGAWRYIVSAGMVALFSMVVVRCVHIVSDRTSLQEERITLFGAGASWWLPQQAAAFIERNHLPPQLFSTFNLSSYLTWRLAPAYKDFADGRYLPFGDELISEQQTLAGLPLDDPQWRQASARYGLRAVIFPLSRFFGIEGIPLRQDCLSRDWAPVYLDSKAVIFLSADALPKQRITALRIDCQSYNIPQRTGSAGSWREHMENYQELANSAVIYLMLGRISDAQRMVDAAVPLTQADPSLPLIQAQIAMAYNNEQAAEGFLRRSLSMRVSGAAWYQLGMLYARQNRYPEAENAFTRAASVAAPHNFQMKLAIGKLQILDGKEQQAIGTLDQALRKEPRVGAAGGEERASALELKAVAYTRLGDWPNAIRAQESAVQETPSVARRWRALAAIYGATGETVKAGNAAKRAEQLGGAN